MIESDFLRKLIKAISDESDEDDTAIIYLTIYNKKEYYKLHGYASKYFKSFEDAADFAKRQKYKYYELYDATGIEVIFIEKGLL